LNKMENREEETSPFVVYEGDVDKQAIQTQQRNKMIYVGWLLFGLFICVVVILLWSDFMMGPWSQTSLVGSPGGFGYDYKCPDGQYVNRIYYTAEDGVNGIGVRCSGSTEDVPTFGVNGGGPGGVAGSFDLPDGVNGAYVTGNQYIGNITPATAGVTTANFAAGGSAKGQYSGESQLLSCPPGALISGMYVRSGDGFTHALGFNCYQLKN
jgi:hypothetical protein